MKPKKIIISTIQSLQAGNFTSNILLTKEQRKIKGGANPWTDGPG